MDTMPPTRARTLIRIARRIGQRAAVMSGAMVFTLVLFLILPLLQQINRPPELDMAVRPADTVLPTPEEEIPEPEPEPPPEPEEIQEPDLNEEPQPLDLSQLEMSLNPGLGGGWTEGDFSSGTGRSGGGASEVEQLFAEADLDQRPSPIYQPGPEPNNRTRARGPGQVFIIFIVGADGSVVEAMVQKSSDPVFERPALAAIRKWKFEPGRRNGEAVRFRMRQRFDFPGS